MNKTLILAFFTGCLSLTQALGASQQKIAETTEKDLKATTSNLTVHVQNIDIGPVKDGLFLADQKAYADSEAYGKCPGSGLFNILASYKQKRVGNDEVCFPLFGLMPQIQIITKTGSILENQKIDSKTGFQWGKNVLGLPGQHIDFTFNINPSEVLGITASLWTFDYGFTSSGGSVWTRYETPVQLTQTVFQQASGKNESFVNFSWPKARPTSGQIVDKELVCQFSSYLSSEKPTLVSNWKEAVGQYVNRELKEGQNKPWCFMTRGFNRSYDGASQAKDYLNIGQAFETLMGHPLKQNPYQ